MIFALVRTTKDQLPNYMDYSKRFKSIINSHYLSEGVRVTAGVLLPAFLMNYFNLLSTGIVISLGALFVSGTDSPGPIHHRRNGMLVCTITLFFVTLLTGFIIDSHLLFAIFLCVACFTFSMISIYGARAGSIGTAVMLVISLTIDPRLDLSTLPLILEHALLITSGGLWYLCYSMLLYNFRPYRLAQQALGDYIEATSEYLSIRAQLYKRNVNYDETYRHLLQQQVIVQHKQTELSELLFKTRSIVKESTNVSRTLVMIHLEVAEIFEKIMMSHQQYSHLHQYFDETDILDEYHQLAKILADELAEAGVAIKSGYTSSPGKSLAEQIEKTREKLDNLRLTYLKPDNIEGFISLRRILENISDLAERLNVLHKYTSYNTKLPRKNIKETEFEKMISHQSIRPDLFLNNLTLKSNTFRHSLRVSITVLVGYFVSISFTIGHSYWVLLTIIVILKPAFSLTKKRNGDRLAGTFFGALIGLILLYSIHNNTALLVLLILLMVASYSFIRTKYFVAVLLMTPYLILFYQLLHPQDFKVLLKDRVVDTMIGSTIAFIASFFLFPSWERQQIKEVMLDMLTAVKEYFTVTTGSFIKKHADVTELQIARKNALVALANLSDAFNRMLAEPKSQQKGIEKLHQFVVLNHILTSYIATLSHYIQMPDIAYNTAGFEQAGKEIEHYLTTAIANMNQLEITNESITGKGAIRQLNEQANELLQKRKSELQEGLMETATRKPLFNLKSIVDQFNLIHNVVVEINKISQTLKLD